MKCPMSCFLLMVALLGARAEPGPVSKVVTLLNDLKTKIDKDSDADEKAYKEHECWCKKVEASKQEIIAKETQLIQDKTSEISAGEAQDKLLENKIAQETEEIASNKDTQKAAAQTRSKQHDASSAQTASNTKVDSDLSKAIKAVSSLGGTSVQRVNDQLSVQRSQVQQAEVANNKSETKAQISYKSLADSMQDQLALLEDRKRQDTSAEAATEMEISEDTEVKVDTEAQKKADEAFLAEATASCLARRIEYQNRTSLRAVELGGINKALETLEGQRKLLSSTFKGQSFLQSADHDIASAAKSAWSSLKEKADKTHSSRLALLAAKLRKSVPEGSLGQVVAQIDKMMQKLKSEAASDVKEKDTCKREYFEIEQKTKKLNFLAQKSDAEVDKMEERLAKLEEERTSAEEELTEVDADLNQSLTLRTKENAAFKQAKADDELAIKVLTNTSEALEKYYKEAASKQALLQYDPSDLSDARKKLKNEEKQYTITDDLSQEGAAAAVIAMLDHIKGNLQKEIADAVEEEKSAQQDYEKSKELLLASKAKLQKTKTNLASIKAKTEEQRLGASTSKTTSEGDLADQKAYMTSIKERCDYLLNNFDDRTSSRESEMDGLVRAKQLLSGATLVQKDVQLHDFSDKDDKATLMGYLGLN